MAVDVKLELFIQLSIEKVLRDGLTGTKLQEPGRRDAANEKDEDWVALHPLVMIRGPSREGVYRGSLTFQVSCFSRYGSVRADKNKNRPWELAGQVRDLFDQKAVNIQTLDGGPIVTLACMQVREQSSVYLPGVSPGVEGRGLVGLASTDTHAVALTFGAFLVQGE